MKQDTIISNPRLFVDTKVAFFNCNLLQIKIDKQAPEMETNNHFKVAIFHLLQYRLSL